MNTAKHKKTGQLKTEQKAETRQKGKYPSIEAAAIAKMESAKEFIANIDMTLFKKNGPVE